MSISKEDMAAFWRALGWMLASDTPLVGALDALSEDAPSDDIAEAALTVREHVLAGRDLGDALREFPELFPAEVCRAASDAQERGRLDEAAVEIAEAIAADDLGGLPSTTVDAPDQPARAFVNAVILTAIQQRASDIHFDPIGDRRVRVRLRVDGVLRDLDPTHDRQTARPREVPCSDIVNRIKAMAGLNVAEKREPQDGRFEINVSGKPFDLRVSSVPTIHGERICMKILSPDRLMEFDLEKLGLLEDDLDTIRGLCAENYGLVLAAGPTGSGKTTLFYAMLNALDRDRSCVFSIEDPVEYDLDGVVQLPINHGRGHTFAHLVRAVLRQDPDVIMVGEIRDPQTANLCVQAAMTGHLVLTTLHADTAPGGLRRLLDLGIEPFMINAVLRGIISQRLVRVLCPECKEKAEPGLSTLPPRVAENIRNLKERAFFAARGCQHCNGTGYRGLAAIHEVLTVDERMREVIAADPGLSELRGAAIEGGMRTMLRCGLAKAARGITTVEEVLRVVPHQNSQ